MTDKPVLLEKIASETYRLYIHTSVLEKGLPPWDEELFNVEVCDESLTSFWGTDSMLYEGYRFQSFYAENTQLAKEFASLVQQVILAFGSLPKPEQEVVTGLIDF
jgi:hypothetical protein